MIYEAGDVVVVPFPFTDREAAKRRPAVVLSLRDFGDRTGQCVLAMITSAKRSRWPLDVEIGDLDAAGLRAECVVRMKLFTLDRRLVLSRAGVLGATDMVAVRSALTGLFGDQGAAADG